MGHNILPFYIMNKFVLPTSKFCPLFEHFAQMGSGVPKWGLLLPTFKFRLWGKAGKSQESGKIQDAGCNRSGLKRKAADISRTQYEETARLMGSAVQGSNM